MNAGQKKRLTNLLSQQLNYPLLADDLSPVGGGCINECYRLKTSAGIFFLKKNNPAKFPGMFAAEARGLNHLNQAVSGIAPQVIAEKENEQEMILILEWIEQGVAKKNFWSDFAYKLASVHRNSHASFGLGYSNYIGALVQDNRPLADWDLFFIERRIKPQLKSAVDSKRLSASLITPFEKLFSKLPEIFPPEAPALVHGDLWSGNFMTGPDGMVRLIDPAIYFGNREADLAMTRLFGGFDISFYRHYQEHFPLQPGFEKRADIYNLYPLLVHVNLFGGYYGDQVKRIVQDF